MEFFGKSLQLEDVTSSPTTHSSGDMGVLDLSVKRESSPSSDSTHKDVRLIIKEEDAASFESAIEVNNASEDEVNTRYDKVECSSSLQSPDTEMHPHEEGNVKAEVERNEGECGWNEGLWGETGGGNILRAALLKKDDSRLGVAAPLSAGCDGTCSPMEQSNRSCHSPHRTPRSPCPSLEGVRSQGPSSPVLKSEDIPPCPATAGGESSQDVPRARSSLAPSLPILTVPKVRLRLDRSGDTSSWTQLPMDSSTVSAEGFPVREGSEGCSLRHVGDPGGGDWPPAYPAAGTSGSGEDSTSADSVNSRPSLLQLALEHGSCQVNSKEMRAPNHGMQGATVRICPILPINPKNTGEVKQRHYKTREKRYYQCQHCNIIYEQAKKLERHAKDMQGKAPYQCCYCEQSFPTIGCRRFHSRLHEDKTLPCPFCPKVFNEKRRYEDHVRSHTGEAPFMCQECGNVYRTRSALRIHKRTHGNDKPLQCRFCPKRFIRIGDVQVHERTHTGEKPYKCGICPSSFATSSQVNRHRRTHSEDRPHECAYCSKTFKNPDYLITHEKMHLGHKPHHCKFCPKTFRTPRELVHHERVHTGEKPFQCKECGHRFSKKTNLKQHELQHTGVKSFTCTKCPKSFYRKSSLMWHEKIHENRERFLCKECGKLFFKETSRDKHLQKAHCDSRTGVLSPGDEDDGDDVEDNDAEIDAKIAGNDDGTVEPWQETEPRTKRTSLKPQVNDGTDSTCEECGKTFLARRSLLRHYRAIHNRYISRNGEGNSPKGKKSYPCRFCSATFPTDHLRHVHEGGHTNAIFSCSTCSKTFSTRQLLFKHEKIHSNVKPHVCETCGSAFTIKWYLNRHMNVVHSDVYSYACHLCEKKFKAKAALSIHMQLHNVEGKVYKCDSCEAEFHVKRYLARHKRKRHSKSGVRKGKSRLPVKTPEEDDWDVLYDIEDDDDFDDQSASGVFLRQMLSGRSNLNQLHRDSREEGQESVGETTTTGQEAVKPEALNKEASEEGDLSEESHSVNRPKRGRRDAQKYDTTDEIQSSSRSHRSGRMKRNSEKNHSSRQSLYSDEYAGVSGEEEEFNDEDLDEEDDEDEKDEDYVADDDTMSEFDTC